MTGSAKIILISLIFGAVAGAIVAFLLIGLQVQPDQNQLIKDFYATENAASVSPHDLRALMDNGDKSFVLVDVRAKTDYELGHIIGAINIPVDGSNETILSAFAALPKDKEIITYCYSASCMASRKVGLFLADNGIYVKHLNIGWNEWRYYWDMWNVETEWNTTNVMDYVVSGSQPGVPKVMNGSQTCSITGAYSC